ncbi:MAG: hypothetical protein Ct9H300mP27_03760 [Chloroflexota bacterium]|nr:MAG: hypothetical protein Ct9H300mP27_03760 [Chloroflexota bacterium]
MNVTVFPEKDTPGAALRLACNTPFRCTLGYCFPPNQRFHIGTVSDRPARALTMLPLKAWLSGVPCAEDVSTDVVNDNDIARPNMNNVLLKKIVTFITLLIYARKIIVIYIN